MARALTMVFSTLAYLVFFATFLYLIGFVGGFDILPVTVDKGPVASPGMAAAIDLGLIALFALQHSVMARPAFKARWTRIVPKPAERSVYVLAASLALIVLFAGWRPIPAVIWSLDGPAAWALWGLFGLGWALVLLSTFLINHFELFGLQQAWFNLRGRTAAAPEFRQPLFYRLVRHPLYTGFFIAFWASPQMTAGHLLLAAGMSVYMLAAIQLEERDLIDVFGDQYRLYRERVGMLVPRLGAHN